jgi:cellulose synthase/poly-beta-1,6-N-acetylglucosamine synthase-like glycosyltransferase
LKLSRKSGEKGLQIFSSFKHTVLKSKGEIIFLLDSDDYFERSKVRKIVHYFYNNPKLDFLQDCAYLVNQKKKKNLFLKIIVFFPLGLNFIQLAQCH